VSHEPAQIPQPTHFVGSTLDWIEYRGLPSVRGIIEIASYGQSL
jgi:hypothetical protein